MVARRFVELHNITDVPACNHRKELARRLSCVTEICTEAMMAELAENAAVESRRHADKWRTNAASRQMQGGAAADSSLPRAPAAPRVRLVDVCPNPAFELALLPTLRC